MHDNDSLHHRLRPGSAAGAHRIGHWGPSTGKNWERASGNKTTRCCHNSTVLITLTILITGLAAYLLTVIVNSRPYRVGPVLSSISHNQSVNSITEPQVDFEDEEHDDREELEKTMRQLKGAGQQRPPTAPHEPLSLSSDIVATRVRPASELHTSENLKRLKEKLSQLKRADLIKLLAMIQERINLRILKKRQISSSQDQIQKSSETSAITDAQRPQQTKSTATSNETEIVVRSRRMELLMGYLDKIEAAMPAINASALERLAALDDDQQKSIVRVVKPDELSTVLLQANSSEIHRFQAPSPRAVVRPQRALTLGSAVELPASWREPVSSVAPQPQEDWPQDELQPEVIEDWPSPTETPVTSSTTQRPRKKKRKKIRTTTTTTTPEPETTTFVPPSTPAPPTASEEIWIEEEEDIVRPPKKKTKKYKKKTSLPPTTTTTTTSTTTTTTPAPVTSTTQQPAIIEDWPEEQSWPEQELEVSTKVPTKLWPSQPQPQQDQHQKWPEEEWLNALRDDIQNRLHIVYA